MSVDWIKIRNEYITGNISYRKLAEKYGITFSTLRYKAEKEDWAKSKKKQQHKTSTKLAQKTAEKIIAQEVDRIDRLYMLSDKLNDKIEQAIDQLDIALVTNKTRMREMEYNDPDAKGKPTKEIIIDHEEVHEIASIIDRQGLQQIANALKAVKDIQTTMQDSKDTITEQTNKNRETLAELLSNPQPNRELPTDE